MTTSHDPVCVFKATTPTQAELIRNLLEAEGILATTADTNYPFPGLPIAPSEVFVERSNEAQALAIIAEAEQNRINDETTLNEEAMEEASET